MSRNRSNEHCALLCFILFTIKLSSCVQNYFCVPRDFGHGSTVCVCSGSYCDIVAPVEPLEDNEAVIYTTTKSGQRLNRTVANWVPATVDQVSSASLVVDDSKSFQKIVGFGGAFTDAAGINIRSLSQLAQDYLMGSYYGAGGIGYNVGRVPMASCDFSTHNYSYDDVSGDLDLVNFNLTMEDYTYKIPLIQQAMFMTAAQNKPPIKFFASPWSAPFWMKTNQNMQGNGTLIGDPGGEFYQSWANYFVKFLDAYHKNAVDFWAVTAQNEPTTGFLYDYTWQTMGFTPETQRDFVKMDLGPALENSAYSNVAIMIMDDQRFMLPSWAQRVLSDPDAAKYVKHIAVHWYGDKYTPPEVLEETHDQFPDFPLFATEACAAESASQAGSGVSLGNWDRGEAYATDIIEDLNYWITGWTDWNLALDPQGGPNWVNNFVDSPIVVNATADEFYKQPMFYALGHFSTFLPPDSCRIGLSSSVKNFNKWLVFGTAFKSADGYNVLILLNKNIIPISLTIAEVSGNSVLPVDLPANGIQTVLWK